MEDRTLANQIRVTPDALRERALQYRNQADKFEQVIAQMDNLLSELQGEWEGAGCEAFTYRYKELKPGFMKAEELIREIAAALDTAARIFEEMDTQIAAQLRDSWQISVGTPFRESIRYTVDARQDILFGGGNVTTF